MLRESELIETLVSNPTWKRIDRMLPEASAADSSVMLAMLLGLVALTITAFLAG